MPYKPGVTGLIPGFSIKTTFGEPLGVPDIKPTQILNQPGRTGLYPGKPQKRWERLTISQTGPLNGSNKINDELCLNIDHIIIHVQKYSDKHTYLL